MSSIKNLLVCSALLAARLAAGHAVITNAVGDAGGSGMALGVDPNTPRDGTGRRPFQQDATRFKGEAAASFGETVGAGTNNLQSGTSKIMALTGGQLPQVTRGGEVTMTVHQVNADGAGPYTCMINGDGSGATWEPIQVTQNVPGSSRGRNRDGQMQDFALKAAVPANQQCTGNVSGQNNVCLVRCQNPARAGPFGGVVPVQMAAGAGAGNGNGNGGNAPGNNAPGNNAPDNNAPGNNAPGNNAPGNTTPGNGNNGNTGNNGNAGVAPPGRAPGARLPGGNIGNAPVPGNAGNAGNRGNGAADGDEEED